MIHSLVKKAINATEDKVWKTVMESLRENETWDLVRLPNGQKPVGKKWVLKKGKCNRKSLEVQGSFGIKGIFPSRESKIW